VNRAGLSLVELVVALLILSMGLVALAGAAATAQRAMARAAAIERITRDAAFVIDSLTALTQPADGQRVADGVSLRWTITADGAGSRIDAEARAFDGVREVELHFHGRHAPR
jgi:Tfp pilus assembly protein PilV